MKHEPSETISAFLDGERYDPADLSEALAAPDARDAMVDFVLLRAGIEQAEDLPSPAFYAEMRRTLAGMKPQAPWRDRWVPALTLAAVIAFAAFGLWIGLKDGSRTGSGAEQPPMPVRTLQFTHWQEID